MGSGPMDERREAEGQGVVGELRVGGGPFVSFTVDDRVALL